MRRKITQFVAWLISILKDEDSALFWCWEMTPLPMGLPSNSQLWNGIKFALKAKKQ